MSIITTALPLPAFMTMISSRFDRSVSGTFSSVLKLGLIFLGLTVLLCPISASTSLFLVWRLLGEVHFLLFCLKSLLLWSFLSSGVFLKYALSLICLKKSFKSVSSSFLLYIFGVGVKFICYFLLLSLLLSLLSLLLIFFIIITIIIYYYHYHYYYYYYCC